MAGRGVISPQQPPQIQHCLTTGLAGDGAGLGEGTGAGLGLGGGGLDTGDGLGTGAGEGAALGLGETNHSVGAGAGVAEARDGTVTLVEAEYFLLLDMVAVSVQMYLPGVRPDTDAEPTLPLSSSVKAGCRVGVGWQSLISMLAEHLWQHRRFWTEHLTLTLHVAARCPASREGSRRCRGWPLPLHPRRSLAVLSAGPLIADTLPSGRQESA